MGAGQIGGVATILDIDFNNAAGFIGVPAETTEAQYIVYFMSHALMFCTGALIEPHVVLTTASCVHGERYKFDVHAGTHQFLEFTGISRTVQSICMHKGYNFTTRWVTCSMDNVALLVLGNPFTFNQRDPNADYILNRVRYASAPNAAQRIRDKTCRFYGWGSRRNGYLIPLLINLLRTDVKILPPEKCQKMWNYDDRYLCIEHPPCRSDRFGALCPDDVGSVVVCSGYIQGLMTSRLVDRPCGVGFLDMAKYSKFLTCGVDDSRDVLDRDISSFFDTHAPKKSTVTLLTTPTPADTTTTKDTKATKSTIDTSTTPKPTLAYY